LRKRSPSFKSIITQNATTKAKTTFCSSPPLLGLSPVGDVASAVENVLAAYSDTTVAPHEYFDQRRAEELRATAAPYTGWAGFNYDAGLPRDQVKSLLLHCAKNDIRAVATASTSTAYSICLKRWTARSR
jgi:hypothetical protein